MEKLAALPIDWANVNWNYFVALVLLVFVCNFLGTALSLGRTVRGCVLTALLFGTAFLFWTYYPHDLPLPTLVKGYNPARPDNPATTNYSSPANFQR